MINVKLFIKNKNVIGFELSGHARYRKFGKDIVCSAVSLLSINTVNAIETMTEDLFECNVREKDGYLYLMMKSDISEQSQLLLNTFKLGVMNVQDEYGQKYINVEIKEV